MQITRNDLRPLSNATGADDGTLPCLSVRTALHRRLDAAMPAIWAPMILLDANAQVLATNDAGRACLEQACALSKNAGWLQARTASDTAHLHRSIAMVAQAQDAVSQTCQIALGQAPEHPTLSVFLMLWDHVNVLALVHVPSPDPSPLTASAARFDFTAAEAAVAQDLVAGLRLKDIALRRSRSISTIRSQLAAVMRKTNTGRQADCIRRLLQA